MICHTRRAAAQGGVVGRYELRNGEKGTIHQQRAVTSILCERGCGPLAEEKNLQSDADSRAGSAFNVRLNEDTVLFEGGRT